MPQIIKASVKWGKEKYDVELNTEEPPLLFKAQLFALTGVALERQKLMIKGKTVSDESWDGLSPFLKDGAQFMLMGSADVLPEAPKQKHVFVEDMSESQLRGTMNIPAGLKNLGNTCYMNATLQCLRTVPEFRAALKKFRPALGGGLDDRPDMITDAIRRLYDSMDSSRDEVTPLMMVAVLHKVFPQFATRGEEGGYQQQDANECWVEVVRMLQQRLTDGSSNAGQGQAAAAASAANASSIVTQYLGGRFRVTLKCKDPEGASEEPVVSEEPFLQLSCYLPQEVKYLQSGLKARLHEEIVKRSVSLDRDAAYDRSSLISRAPAYLTVQMVRFEYKEQKQVNAKILKEVKYTLSLDIYELCTQELQQKFIPMREQFKAESDRQLALAEAKKKGELVELSDPKPKQKLPFSFPDDPGSNNSGFYELQAVLTHKGRASNSGHYVAWIKVGPNSWVMCDDDTMSSVTDEDILRLAGGGDWHCAYVLLYGPRVLELDEEAIKKQKEAKNGVANADEMEIGTPV